MTILSLVRVQAVDQLLRVLQNPDFLARLSHILFTSHN
jgi:hypothetical protein